MDQLVPLGDKLRSKFHLLHGLPNLPLSLTGEPKWCSFLGPWKLTLAQRQCLIIPPNLSLLGMSLSSMYSRSGRCFISIGLVPLETDSGLPPFQFRTSSAQYLSALLSYQKGLLQTVIAHGTACCCGLKLDDEVTRSQ